MSNEIVTDFDLFNAAHAKVVEWVNSQGEMFRFDMAHWGEAYPITRSTNPYGYRGLHLYEPSEMPACETAACYCGSLALANGDAKWYKGSGDRFYLSLVYPGAGHSFVEYATQKMGMTWDAAHELFTSSPFIDMNFYQMCLMMDAISRGTVITIAEMWDLGHEIRGTYDD